MLVDTIKIRCYGESFKIHTLKFDNKYEKQFYKVAEKFNQPIEKALLDIRFFETLNIVEYQSIYDLSIHTMGGLINNSKNKIEIKKGRKRLQQFTMRELTFKGTLFPLFNVVIYPIQLRLPVGIYLIEQEVGMINEYNIEANNLKIDTLKFFITDLDYEGNRYELFTDLHYDKNPIESIKSDSLITYRNCINKLNIDQ